LWPRNSPVRKIQKDYPKSRLHGLEFATGQFAPLVCPLRLSHVDGCFLGPFRGKDFCRSFQFCGCRSRWATEAMATRSGSILVSWSHGSWGVLSYALGSKLGLGPKTGSLSRSETIPTCKATIMFEPYPNSCTVLEGR
jgi:hypothetical protein